MKNRSRFRRALVLATFMAWGALAAAAGCRGSVERIYDDGGLDDAGEIPDAPTQGDTGAHDALPPEDAGDAGIDAEIDAPLDTSAPDAKDGGPAVCGNGKIEPGETCDDGRTDACGACNATCTGPGNGKARAACACEDGGVAEVFTVGMAGCPGSVTWADRAKLCTPACPPCASTAWVAQHGLTAPGHHYWTDDDLHYNGSGASNCFVSIDGGTACTGAPMRVCRAGVDAGSSIDPENNVCNWWNCGFDSLTPNQYFGGCSGNTTAGTLCCCP
jgi:hypothetical protein